MSGLVAYLRHAKETLSSCKKVQVVMGNEACDLDSAVSAITYAFLLHSLRAEREDKESVGVVDKEAVGVVDKEAVGVVDKEAVGVGVVPVLNIPRRDFPLRTEVTHWLGRHGVSPEVLVFRDEINLHDLHEKGNLQLFLVDHNILPAGDACLESAVCYVIDHHRLERQVGAGRDEILLEMVGSCATLIAERMLRENRSSLEDERAVRLLHGTIILDTINLSDEAKRVTPKDVQALEELEAILKAPPDRRQIFAELTSAKGDISSLATEELLRKDRKVVVGGGGEVVVGVSSLPLTVQDYLQRADVGVSLAQHSDLQGAHAVVLMGISLAGNSVERDIAVYSKDEALRRSVSSRSPSTSKTRKVACCN
ncbi:exopolyphosphatase PRUNE1-like isoform X2 [Penaeus monodon]|uniref:exopolyphosphatase PRUNE1-like isoform X2 n=1 Tax=Penaeus monodon TaxID=6687 RepID=UPI0018A77F21|nr:exopolyphosphatase PRUNE1-like isoform X2 [Penaeus monodon]